MDNEELICALCDERTDEDNSELWESVSGGKAQRYCFECVAPDEGWN